MRTPIGGPWSATTRILAVTIAACGFLFAPAPALAKGRAGDELAQPARNPHHHARPQVRPADEADPAGSKAKAPAEKSRDSEAKPSDQDSKPDEDEEVSPGDSPASCDGCELAGFALGGSLWGLFGVTRRRGVPRAVIRGLQPR
jgi:hypothetical protein